MKNLLLTKNLLKAFPPNLGFSRSKIHQSIWTILVLSNLISQSVVAANTLPDSIQKKLIAAQLPADSVSIIVQPLDTPTIAKDVSTSKINSSLQKLEPLIAYNPNIPRTPASTQKLIPTFIALDKLGKDFTWQTRLYQHGFVWRGTLYGDIILKAGGDPKLDAQRLYELLNMVKSQGIERIDGDFILDNRLFENVNFDPNNFDGKGLRPYNAAPNALLVNFGTIKVDLLPITQNATQLNQSNKQLVTQTQPLDTDPSHDITLQPNLAKPADITGFKVTVNPVITDFKAPSQIAATQDRCALKSEDWIARLTTTELTFTSLPSAYCGAQQQWLTFPDSEILIKKIVTADWYSIQPNFKGKIVYPEQYTPPSSWWRRWIYEHTKPKLIAYIRSAPLSEQISDINHFSNNVMTEQVTLSLPIYADKKTLSNYPLAFEFIQRWWREHLPSTQPPVMTRGSGLCRDCQITPISMMDLLKYAYHHPDFATFKQSLSVAGESGTMKHLKDRQPNNPAIGRAWIKTGTLDNVSSMVGYIQGNSGKWYAVVGMINMPNLKGNPNAKAVLDEMLAWTATQ